MAVSDWSTTPVNNVTIDGADISEGCSPAGLNNALRAVMSEAKAKFDALDAASVRGDGVNNGGTYINVEDADFVVSDQTDVITAFIYRDHSEQKLFLGTENAVPTTRADMETNGGDSYWHAGNDGAGSGLDADKLDGLHASDFQKNLADTAQIEFGQNRQEGNRFIDFHTDGLATDFNARIIRRGGVDGDYEIVQSGAGVIEITGGADFTRDDNTIWHAGNDGSGSGLDADKLDGLHASQFLRSDSGDVEINSVDIGLGSGDVPTNTALGSSALRENTTGESNLAVGFHSLFDNTTGDKNTAVGYGSLRYNSTGDRNTAVGHNALIGNTTGVDNTALGKSALNNNTTGSNNTAAGYNALYSNETGVNATAFGYNALQQATAGGNAAFGVNALKFTTTGLFNTALGNFSLENNTTGENNTASGHRALTSNTTGYNNTAVGYRSLYYNTTGNSNTAAGYGALNKNTTGNNNLANGRDALNKNTTGSNNVASGHQALLNNTTGDNNTAAGVQALLNVTGVRNTGVGRSAGSNITSGNYNTAVGSEAEVISPTANDQIAIRAGTTKWYSAAGSPEGVVTAGIGSLYTDTSGGEGTTLYVKEVGTGSTGWVAHAQLPERLKGYCQIVTDWDNAGINGWYMGINAANAPSAGVWYMGTVTAHDPDWATQDLHEFVADGSSDWKRWRRHKNNGVWSSWHSVDAVSSTQLGAVGTYAFLARYDGEQIAAGNTYAGSQLRYNAVASQNDWSYNTSNAPSGVVGGGTWRAMGQNSGSASNHTVATIMVRIS